MNANDWRELAQLAGLLCPVVLHDLPLMTLADARGTLLWLQQRAKELQT